MWFSLPEAPENFAWFRGREEAETEPPEQSQEVVQVDPIPAKEWKIFLLPIKEEGTGGRLAMKWSSIKDFIQKATKPCRTEAFC